MLAFRSERWRALALIELVLPVAIAVAPAAVSGLRQIALKAAAHRPATEADLAGTL